MFFIQIKHFNNLWVCTHLSRSQFFKHLPAHSCWHLFAILLQIFLVKKGSYLLFHFLPNSLFHMIPGGQHRSPFANRKFLWICFLCRNHLPHPRIFTCTLFEVSQQLVEMDVIIPTSQIRKLSSRARICLGPLPPKLVLFLWRNLPNKRQTRSRAHKVWKKYLDVSDPSFKKCHWTWAIDKDFSGAFLLLLPSSKGNLSVYSKYVLC